jgi:hypothetical protein
MSEVVIKVKKRNYLNNHDFLIELGLSKKEDRMTKKFELMLIMLCDRYAKKGNFANYSYLDDMKGSAMLNLCKIWRSFDETLYDNPFAYYTQSIKNSFVQYLNKEKRQRTIKDTLLVRQGLDPSHNFVLEYEDEHHHHHHGDVEFNQPILSDNIIHMIDNDVLEFEQVVVGSSSMNVTI